jgi:sulfatase modifying factor 1
MKAINLRGGGLLGLFALFAACGNFRPSCPEGRALQGSRCVVAADVGADASAEAGADAMADVTVEVGRDCGGTACADGGGSGLTQRSCPDPMVRGCGMVRFVGGTFTQGEAGASQATPTMTMTVSPFAIDAYEVTVARFRVFWAARSNPAVLAALRASPIAYRGGNLLWGTAQAPALLDEYCNWSETDSPVAMHPMNCVDYWLAQEFCVWDGGRLPTETEWEFAARGSAVDGLSPARVFPWGADALTCDRGHFNLCTGDGGRRTREVGRLAATAGLFDLAGNVWEWTADNFSMYPTCRGSGMDTLCNLNPSAARVVRGGSWGDDAGNLRAASRSGPPPTTRIGGVGFRCARDAPL